MKRFVFFVLAVIFAASSFAASSFAAKRDTLRILSIGNSFSEDAVEQNLADLARADGRCAIIGNLYIGGCPLSRHWENVKQNKSAYRYRTIDSDGVMTTFKNFRISDAVKSMHWDVVSLQQSSPLSGKIESYEPYIQELVSWLRANLPPDTKLMFHQTWAYSANGVRKEYANYGCDQRAMYDSIMVATKTICERYGLDVIPAGTAIQNGRATSIRDNFCRDGYHLSHSCGRYTAACTWYEKLFSRPVRGNLYRADIQPDYDTSTKGIRSVYPQDAGVVCGPDQWGAIAAWAWGLSRALDYLCTDKDVDASRVALIGHSRLAKTALWAGAVDSRFAMVIANESGCGGAAISRRSYGETVGIINRSFPHWFCDNFKKYSENESALPVDQHELLALIAPRPLCIGSAREDRWSDPQGERLGMEAALKVYDLYGKSASSRVAYHIRDGRHEIYPEDWEAYLRFAGRFL